MPIRFRCAYCNQLMGISRRKAGTVVKCPKCAGEIIVPALEEDAPEDEAASPANPFEELNFNLNSAVPAEASAAATAGVEPPPELPPPPALTPPPPRRIGVFLPLWALALSVIFIIFLLIVMFVV